jgi:hypothetical protein
MAGLVLLVEWVASAVFGWLGFWWWLAVPPVVALLITMAGNGRALSRLRDVGIGTDEERAFVASVMPSTIKFVVWQGVLNALIFLASRGLSSLFD